VRAAWQLAPDRLLTRIEVEATDDGSPGFPASVGWHPWFRRRLAVGEDLQVDVPGAEMLERGPDHLPTGRVLSARPPGPYDDAFPLPDGLATLRWPGALELECRTDCRFLVLYDEQQDGVCVEPQTAPPDGLNTAPDLVAPGRPLVATASWSWTCEPARAA
jgi:galactose mutarotase-like enzyme